MAFHKRQSSNQQLNNTYNRYFSLQAEHRLGNLKKWELPEKSHLAESKVDYIKYKATYAADNNCIKNSLMID